jgi:hypothetical protein
MDENSLQQELHKLYQGNTTYPASTEEDYIVRRGLLNGGVDLWENEKGIFWNELFTTYTDTIATGVTSKDLTADFRLPAGNFYILSSGNVPTYYRFIKPHQQSIELSNSSAKYFYITGSPGAYKLNIHPTPTAELNGLTCKLDYYKTATKITGITDVIEMADPYFAIYFALAKLFMDDGSEQASVMMQIAMDKLSNMRIKNEVMPFYNPDLIPDPDGTSFGN